MSVKGTSSRFGRAEIRFINWEISKIQGILYALKLPRLISVVDMAMDRDLAKRLSKQFEGLKDELAQTSDPKRRRQLLRRMGAIIHEIDERTQITGRAADPQDQMETGS